MILRKIILHHLLLFIGVTCVVCDAFSATVWSDDLMITVHSGQYICYEDRLDFDLVLAVKNNATDTVGSFSHSIYSSETVLGSGSFNQSIEPSGIELITYSHLSIPVSGVVQLMFVSQGDAPEQVDTNIINVHIMNELITSALSDTSVCAGETVYVTAETGFSAYSWSDGKSVRSNSFNSAGTYRVTVTDGYGCEAIDTIIVDYFDVPTALAPGDTTICKGEILNASVNPSFAGVAWSNGLSGSNVLISDSGLYELQITDQYGCVYVDSFTVGYHPQAAPGVVGNVFVCDGDTVELSANPGFYSYGWSNGENSNSIIVTSSGVYTVSVMGPEGCVGYDTANVMVNPLPEISFSDSLMCNNVPLLVDVGSYSSYTWSSGDSSSFKLISQPGVYAVSVEDFSGCTNSDSITVTNVNVSVNLGADTVLCEGASLFAMLPNVYDEIQWDNGDTSSFHFIGSNGTHEVTVKKQGCSASDAISVTEDPVPLADFDYITSSPMISFTNYSNSTSCEWFFGDGNSSSAFEPNHTFSMHGEYDVMLKVKTACGVDSLTKKIGIYPQAIGNLGMGNHVKVYPTITSSELGFELSNLSFSNVSFLVYSASGQLIMEKELNYLGGKYLINVTSLAAGQYYLVIGIDNLAATHTTTFIKE